jgi:hypothetical protein
VTVCTMRFIAEASQRVITANDLEITTKISSCNSGSLASAQRFSFDRTNHRKSETRRTQIKVTSL